MVCLSPVLVGFAFLPVVTVSVKVISMCAVHQHGRGRRTLGAVRVFECL